MSQMGSGMRQGVRESSPIHVRFPGPTTPPKRAGMPADHRTAPAQYQRVEWASPGGHEPSQTTDQRLPPIDWLIRVRIAFSRDRQRLCQHAP